MTNSRKLILGIMRLLKLCYPYLLIVIFGIAGTELYKVAEGVGGSPYVNSPGSVSVIDEGQLLDWASRILHGQIPYKDFSTLYSPLRPYFLAGFMKFFGESVYTERLYLAIFPLLGFLAFYQLAKLLTNNTILSILAVILAISSQSITERNSLFIIAVMFMVQSQNTAGAIIGGRIMPQANKFIFFSGFFSALSFLISQEYGIYSVLGTLVYFLLFLVFHKNQVKNVFYALVKYFAGILLIIAPYFCFLLITGTLVSFINDVIINFINGPIIRLFSEPFPGLFIQNPSSWFYEKGYLFDPVTQAYLYILFFTASLSVLLLFTFKHRNNPLIWNVYFAVIFALVNLRGLFYSVSFQRRQGVFVFFILLVFTLNAILIKFFHRISKFFIYAILLPLVIMLNWYAITNSNLPLFLGNFFEMMTVAHRPKGILVDNKRVMIRVYPTNIEKIIDRMNGLHPTVNALNSQAAPVNREIPLNSVRKIQVRYKKLFNHLSEINLVYSEIINMDNNFLTAVRMIKKDNSDLMADSKKFYKLITVTENNIITMRKNIITSKEIDDQTWFDLSVKIKYLESVKLSVGQIIDLTEYIKNNFSKEIIQQYNRELTAFMTAADFLRNGKGKYAFGIPYPSVYLFVADKINPTQYSYYFSNLSLTQQKEIINTLEMTKPCRVIRVSSFGIAGSNVIEYLPLVWDYLQTNYRIVENVSGIELMERPLCGHPEKLSGVFLTKSVIY